MTAIRIRLLRDPGILSRFICWWTWGRWSHVEIALPEGYLGARLRGGVQIRPLDYCKPVRQEIRTMDVTEDEASTFMTFARAQIGKPYDWRAILGFGVRADHADAPDRWFCSEFVSSCFAAAGVPVLHTSAAYRISPRDVGLSPTLGVSVNGNM